MCVDCILAPPKIAKLILAMNPFPMLVLSQEYGTRVAAVKPPALGIGLQCKRRSGRRAQP
jgi:hypothetical protein